MWLNVCARAIAHARETKCRFVCNVENRSVKWIYSIRLVCCWLMLSLLKCTISCLHCNSMIFVAATIVPCLVARSQSIFFFIIMQRLAAHGRVPFIRSISPIHLCMSGWPCQHYAQPHTHAHAIHITDTVKTTNRYRATSCHIATHMENIWNKHGKCRNSNLPWSNVLNSAIAWALISGVSRSSFSATAWLAADNGSKSKRKISSSQPFNLMEGISSIWDNSVEFSARIQNEHNIFFD